MNDKAQLSRSSSAHTSIERVARTSQRRHQEKLTGRTARLMMILVALAIGLASFEERNDPVVTLIFYSPIALSLAIIEGLLRRGLYRAAGWAVSCLFFAVVASATWFFGGLKYEMGSAFVISVMLAGATLGGGAGIGFGAASVAFVSFVAWAQIQGFLPPSMAPESFYNAWIAVSVSLLLASVLLHSTVRSTEEAWREAARTSEEKSEVETKYQVAQKLEPIGRMASGVAHDFNNILNIVANVASLLRDAPQEEREELLDELDSASKRGELMTRQLLSFNRTREFEMKPLELTALVSTMIPVLTRLLGDDVRVVATLPRQSVWVIGDQGQLEQVLMNLGVNARDAMPGGGRLSITLEKMPGSARKIRLVVADSGAGMDSDTASRVFEPFFSTKATGTGLGLVTVKDIVQRHEGTMSMVSIVGAGTTFEVVLPEVSEESEAVAASHRSIPVAQTGLRILLVEDEPNVRRAHGRLLEAMGHEVIVVGNGAEALSLVSTSSEIDVVVSDVSMPIMDGLELVRRLRTLASSPPVVLVTGHLGEPPPEVQDNPVVAAFLVKPVAREQLTRAIAQAMRG